jgi:hypothetical protein
MKRRVFFGLFCAAPAALPHPAAAPEVRPDPAEMNFALNQIARTPMPAGLSHEARIDLREHIARNAIARLHEDQIRFIARCGQ